MTWEELVEKAKEMGYVQITDFPNYFINKNGDVINRHFKRIKPLLNHNGYWRVGLWREGKPYRRFVHRLLAKEFIENTENKPSINHKNGIRTDNRINNLEWVTPSENNFHKIRVLKNTGGTVKRGQARKNHPASKKIWCKELNRTFDCILDASDELGISRLSIGRSLKDGSKRCGYHFYVYDQMWQIMEALR